MDNEKANQAAGLNDEERTSEYFLVLQQLERTRGEIRRIIQRPEHCLPFIQVRYVGRHAFAAAVLFKLGSTGVGPF